MNWEAISAIGQMVGAIGVIISLIYLAREVRKNARSARRASVDTMNQWLGQVAQHQHLCAVFVRGIQDESLESLQGVDWFTFNLVMLQWFRVFAEMYYQQLEREMDPRLWRETEMIVSSRINLYPGIQAWWRLNSVFFSEEFVNYVNQLTAKRPSEPDAHQ